MVVVIKWRLKAGTNNYQNWLDGTSVATQTVTTLGSSSITYLGVKESGK